MGEEPDPTPEPEPKTITQEDLNRILARDRKKHEAELAERPTAEQLSEVQAQLKQLTDEHEMAGKSEIEKLQAQNARDVEKLNIQVQKLSDESKAKDDAVTAAQSTLRNERVSRTFGAALSKANVYGGASSHALAVLMAEVKDVDIDGNGAVRASYGGDLIDEDPDAIAKKFLENCPYFATAKVGGAGTTPPNGAASPKNLDDATTDEMFAAAGPDPSARQ